MKDNYIKDNFLFILMSILLLFVILFLVFINYRKTKYAVQNIVGDNAESIPILFYKDLDEEVNIKEFEKDVEYLIKDGYEMISMNRFNAWKKGEVEQKNKTVVIITDTYNEEFLKSVGPFIDKYAVNLTSFLKASTMDFPPLLYENLMVYSGGFNLDISMSVDEIKNDILASEEFVSLQYIFNETYTKELETAIMELDLPMLLNVVNRKVIRKDNNYKVPVIDMLKFDLEEVLTTTKFN